MARLALTLPLLAALLAPLLISFLLLPMQQAEPRPYRIEDLSSAGYLVQAGPPLYAFNAAQASWVMTHDGLNATVRSGDSSICIISQGAPRAPGYTTLLFRLPAPLALPLLLRATVNSTPGAFVHIRAQGVDPQGRPVQLWDELGPLDDLQPSPRAEVWGSVPSHKMGAQAAMTEFEFILDLLSPSPSPPRACLLHLTLSPLRLLRASAGSISLGPNDVALLFPSSPSPAGFRQAMLRSIFTLHAGDHGSVTPLFIASNESAYVGEGIAGGLLPHQIGYDIPLVGQGLVTGRTPGHLYSALLDPPGAMLYLELSAPAELDLEGLEVVYAPAPEGGPAPSYAVWLYFAYAFAAPLALIGLSFLRKRMIRPHLMGALGLGLRLGLAPFTGHPLDSLLFSLSARNYLLEGREVQGAVFPLPVYLDLLPLYAYLRAGGGGLDLYFAEHVVGSLELLLLKLPFMLFDLLAYALLAACLKRLVAREGDAWRLAGLYYLNPLALTVSSAWLQYDGLSCALLLAALLMMLRARGQFFALSAFLLAALSGPLGLFGFILYCAQGLMRRSLAIYQLAALLGVALPVFGPNLLGPMLFWSGLSARLPSRHPISLLGALQSELRFALPSWYPLALLAGGSLLIAALLRRAAVQPFAWLLSSLFYTLLLYYMAYFYVFEQHYLWALCLLPLMAALTRRKAILPLMASLGVVVALAANPAQLISGAPSPLAGAYSEAAGLLARALASLLLLACGALYARRPRCLRPAS